LLVSGFDKLICQRRLKNLINQGIALLNFFNDMAAQQLQSACIAVSGLRDLFNVTISDRIKQECTEAFMPHQVSFAPISELPEAKIQLSSFGLLNTIVISRKAGFTLTDTVLILNGIAEIAEAVKAVTAVDSVMVKIWPEKCAH
jgi:hypothetical protein